MTTGFSATASDRTVGHSKPTSTRTSTSSSPSSSPAPAPATPAAPAPSAAATCRAASVLSRPGPIQVPGAGVGWSGGGLTRTADEAWRQQYD